VRAQVRTHLILWETYSQGVTTGHAARENPDLWRARVAALCAPQQEKEGEM
jgi:hypothetical protein